MGRIKKKHIIIWLVSWATLLLVVAYSPIGRPDLYVGTSYQVYNRSVNFKGGIANAPTGNYTQSDYSDIEAPTYTPANSSNGAYEGNASSYSPQSSGGSGYSSESSNQSTGNENNASGVVLAYNSRKSAAQGTSTAQNNDISSLSSDLTLTSNVENRQATRPVPSNGGRDPGGKNPKNTIPVGEGTWVLLTLVGVYTIWKMKLVQTIITKKS